MAEATEKADSADEPVTIISAAEAAKRGPAKGTKTWVYQADNVRDVAFALLTLCLGRHALHARRRTAGMGHELLATRG